MALYDPTTITYQDDERGTVMLTIYRSEEHDTPFVVMTARHYLVGSSPHTFTAWLAQSPEDLGATGTQYGSWHARIMELARTNGAKVSASAVKFWRTLIAEVCAWLDSPDAKETLTDAMIRADRCEIERLMYRRDALLEEIGAIESRLTMLRAPQRADTLH